MAEEHRCEATEGHCLCVNNCGFFGSPATMGLCSKCYRDYCLKEQQEASTKSTIEAAFSASASSPSSSPIKPLSDDSVPPPLALPEIAEDLGVPSAMADVPEDASRPNRCTVCRKRVGYTGFRCKCGTTYCGVHRYPEKHGCTFDFKKVGKEEIARANPLVKADKLMRI